MMKQLLLGLIFLSQCCFAATDEKLTPQDFAYGIPIELNNNASVQRITLPLGVYQKLVADNLSDISIFNAQGHVVNFTIITPAISQQKWAQQLQFFPIYSDSSSEKTIHLEFTRAEDGSVIVKKPEGKTREKRLTGYLVDTRKLKGKTIEGLILTWVQTNDTWIKQVKLLASNDLMNWTTLSNSNSLAQLKHNKNLAIKNMLTINKIPYNYLLIKANDSLTIAVKAITATILKQRMDQYRWSAIDQLAHRKLPNEYEFSTPHSLPVSALQIDFIDNNVVEEFVVSSRANNKQPWRIRATASIYNINMSNQPIKHNIIRFAPTRDTQWQLKTANMKVSLFTAKIGWIPENLYFVTTGNPPFILAYGSGKARSKTFDRVTILKEFTTKLNTDTAALGKAISLGGEKALQVPPKPLDYKVLLLWATLLGGVFIVARMTLSLFKQLQNHSR